MKLVMLVMLLQSALAQAGEVPSTVKAAHDAYLKRDGAALVRNVKKSLEKTSNHPAMVKNLMGLYSAAKQNGLLDSVDPGFEMPREVSWMVVDVVRRYRTDNGKVTFALAASTGIEKPAELEQLQIIRYPNAVIVDKAAKIGDSWEGSENGVNSYWLGGAGSPKRIEDGLYLLNYQLKGQVMVQGWFLLENKNASASPVIKAPVVDQVLKTSQPTVQWVPFKSPEFDAKNESVRIDVKVSRNDGTGDDLLDVHLDEASSPTSYKVGDKAHTKHYDGVTYLQAGSYFAHVVYREVEKFGPLRLRRTSTTRVPFIIQ